jgi:hypothetical protein
MATETLRFGEGTVEVTVNDNVIFMKTLGLYTDEMAMAMTRYLDRAIAAVPSNPVRIWDSSDLPAGSFRLSSECVKAISHWSRGIKEKRPGSKAYFIARDPLIFGVSRMYQLQAADENMDVIVLKRVEDLPPDLRARIPA